MIEVGQWDRYLIPQNVFRVGIGINSLTISNSNSKVIIDEMMLIWSCCLTMKIDWTTERMPKKDLVMI